MPKMKSRSCVKKRFRLTATGKPKSRRAYTSHILTKKSRKRKRKLRRPHYVNESLAARVRWMLSA